MKSRRGSGSVTPVRELEIPPFRLFADGLDDAKYHHILTMTMNMTMTNWSLTMQLMMMVMIALKENL